jgi:hypothetical protein
LSDQRSLESYDFYAAVIGIFCEVEFWCKVAKPHQNGAKQKMPITALLAWWKCKIQANLHPELSYHLMPLLPYLHHPVSPLSFRV